MMDDHFREHDPIVDHNHCQVCAEALRRALNAMADLELGPKDARELANRLRRIAIGEESA
jgi:hypothetical protein